MNAVTSPIVVAILKGRADLVSEMLDKAPRKPCAGLGGRHKPRALLERLTVVDLVGRYAAEAGMKDAQRRMVADYFANIPAMKGDGYFEYAYDDMMRRAWSDGLGDLFKARPLAEAAASRDFLPAVAAHGSLADLEYWTAKLRPHGPDALASMIDTVADRLGDESKRALFEAKLDYLLGLADRLAPDDKLVVLRRVFGDGSLGATTFDREAPRILVAAFVRHGYDLSSPMMERRCPILLLALSYFGECDHAITSPGLAEALLEHGADANLGRAAGGLSALDLARKRAAGGPYERDFARVAVLIERAGGRSARR